MKTYERKLTLQDVENWLKNKREELNDELNHALEIVIPAYVMNEDSIMRQV